MMLFPSMLVPAAELAGIKVPENPDDFDKNQFPHFAVFCTLQLARPMQSGEHWENAEIIAKITEQDVKTKDLEFFLGKGLRWQ